MFHLKINAVIFAVFCWVCLPVLALPQDQKQPASIQSDQANYNHNTGIATYMGHVIAQQGSTRLNADRLLTYSDKNNRITKAIAFGNPAHYQTLEALNKPPLIAEATRIEYDPIHKNVWLIGHAKVIQGKNVVTSPRIFYDMMQESAQTFSDKTQRTVILFQPETNHP